MPMTADEAFAQYKPPHPEEFNPFTPSDPFPCPACEGSGVRAPSNGVDDVRCTQCMGTREVQVVSTCHLEWLRDEVARNDDVGDADRAIAARAREELGRLKERLTCLVSRYDECTVPTSKGKLAGLIGDLRVEITLLRRILGEDAS